MKWALMDPRVWLAMLMWTMVMLGLGALYGSEQAREEAAIETNRITVQALNRQATVNDTVLANERALRAQDRERFTTYREETAHAQEISDRLVADLRRDAIRLRVPVRSVCSAPGDGSGPAATGTEREGHAELTQDAAEFVVGLLARGDTGIRKHAAVVDLYENLRQKCSAPISPNQPEEKP
jgi:hypothetical protein